MHVETLFDDGTRQWTFFGRDPKRPEQVIDTNEYLVVHAGKGMMLDPGGIEIFPQVVTAVSRRIALDDVEVLFASHQDPDILSSLSLWVKLCPQALTYVPQIWAGFIRHFSRDANFRVVPDGGGTIDLGGSRDLQIVPAHYLHSSGNFSVYDPRARILWTGDIGSALLPADAASVFVTDFDRHTSYMEGFHRRWMPSPKARDRWIDRVAQLDVAMICPQHGAVFEGEQVGRFLQWFADLDLASAVGV